MFPALLTIAIPTYNRNAILLANIRPLLEQLAARTGAGVRLLVIDNASPQSVEETLAPLRHEFAGVEMQVQRNAANIGANANILRCFELCQTPFLWILGDDDTPLPDALDTVLRSLEAHPECVFFNFSSEMLMRAQSKQARGLNEFLATMDSLWATLFISSSIYRAGDFKEALRVGYRFEYSHAPQLVTLLSHLAASKEKPLCRFCPEQIVHWHQPDDDQQWPIVNYALGIATILELPLPPRGRRRLAGLIVESLNLELLVLQLLLGAVRSPGGARAGGEAALFLFDQMCARLFYFDQNPGRKIRLLGYRLLLRAPRQSYALLTRLKGRSRAAEHKLQDLFERI